MRVLGRVRAMKQHLTKAGQRQDPELWSLMRVVGERQERPHAGRTDHVRLGGNSLSTQAPSATSPLRVLVDAHSLESCYCTHAVSAILAFTTNSHEPVLAPSKYINKLLIPGILNKQFRIANQPEQPLDAMPCEPTFYPRTRPSPENIENIVTVRWTGRS